MLSKALLLATLRHLVLGAVIDSRQSSTASQIVKIASIENVAVRSNDIILATNMNSANPYAVDPVAKTSSTAVVVTGATGLSGIGEVTPDSSLIKTINEASNLNGLAILDKDTVLVADAGKGSVYRFSVSTGAYSVAISDPTMAPSGTIPFGIDGTKYNNGTVWYTNIFKNSFHKVPVDSTGKATGAVTTLWTDLIGDDLCIGPNGKIYVATNGKSSLVEVDATATSPKPVSVGTVSGSTYCGFGRTDKDKSVVYVGGGQGVFALTLKI